MTSPKQHTQCQTHQVEVKLTDAAMGGIDWNAMRAIITLSTLFAVYTSRVMLERNKRNLEVWY